MKSFTTLFLAALSATGAMAACNCKCQDPSGEGPQWNDLTKAVCDQKLGDETGLCQFDKSFLSDKNNQCAASGCCIDAGAFNDMCEELGAPGAYCWT